MSSALRARIAAILALAVTGTGAAVWASEQGPAAVSYAGDVQPIFDRSCTSCHPVAYPYLDLRAGHSYNQLVRVPSATDPAFARVLPGRPELSYLLTHPPDPSNAGLLTPADRDLIARWIRAGAADN
jgi:mono/diheme cytochrome c family protein